MRSAVSLALAALGLAGCETTVPLYPLDMGPWRTHVAYDGGIKLGGCALGDLVPELPGDEIAVVSSAGEVLVITRRGGLWESEVVLATDGELIQIAAGDLDPDTPGDELVAVGVVEGGEDDGGIGVAWYLWRAASGWAAHKMLEDSALLHGVCIADVAPDIEGNEVCLVGYSRDVHVIGVEAGQVVHEVVGTLPGDGKGVAAARGGIAVACADGTTAIFVPNASGVWREKPGFSEHQALARIAGRGDEILVAGNDGRLRLYQATDEYDEARTTVCLRVEDRLRGAVFADVDPTEDGEELATAGYDGRIYVVMLDAADPSQELVTYTARRAIVGVDRDRFHHLAAGELAGLGTCLVGCGYSGRVLVVSHVGSGSGR